MILGGVLASGDDPTLSLPLVIAAGAAGALCGDNVSYLIGRLSADRFERWVGEGERAPGGGRGPSARSPSGACC